MTFAQLGLIAATAFFAIVAIFCFAILILKRNDRAAMQAAVRRQLAEVEGERERKIGVAGAGR